MMEAYFQRHNQLWLVVLCVVAFGAAYFSPLKLPGDSLGSLLTAQAILQHRTIQLDSYVTVGDKPYGANYQFIHKGGHVYYFFPLGTSLLSLPFIWLANLRGQDMADAQTHLALENSISALTVAAASLLIYLQCRAFVNHAASFLITITFVFGSAIMSTMGSSLWSFNFSTLLVLWVLLRLTGDEGGRRAVNPYWLGVVLFVAYLCRPSLAVFGLAVLTYSCFQKGWGFAGRLALVAGSLAVVFVLYSWLEFRQLLPAYYLPQRLAGNQTFWLALYGNLFSPARGLLVYSPYLLLTAVGCVVWFRWLRQQPLFWLAAITFILLLVTISRFPHWWGGWSFGNRLLTDALPVLLLLTLLVWSGGGERLANRLRQAAVAAFSALSLVAVFFHTHQGLYNLNTYYWNDNPHIDFNPAYLFDWRYPQFLASPAQLAERWRWHQLGQRPPYSLGDLILPDSPAVLFESWYDPETTDDGLAFRWSNGPSARLVFRPAGSHWVNGDRLVLNLSLDTFREQTVYVFFNQRKVGVFSSQARPLEVSFGLPTRLVYRNRPNVIEFVIPGAVSPAEVVPGHGDSRVLGVLFRQASITTPAP